jgi:hypothetical protein
MMIKAHRFLCGEEGKAAQKKVAVDRDDCGAGKQ